VGRQRELTLLALLPPAVVEDQRPQLVSLVAPAGTGKTRLVEEFRARLDPALGFWMATARCPPYGQTLTYWPLRGLLYELLGGELAPEPARQRVGDILTRGGHASEDAAHLADLVLATLGVEHEGALERDSIFNAWRLFLEALARRAPGIVIFEDLHWAGDSLLDLVEHLMHPHTQAPLLLIVLSRPELLDRRPVWGGGRRGFTALDLEPLSVAQTRALVTGLPHSFAPGIRERIVERSGGNPFFAIELARALAERELDRQLERATDSAARATDGRATDGRAADGGAADGGAADGGAADGGATDGGAADVLPDTVHEALLARLDLLSAPERSVARAAAVVGRGFDPAALGAVLPDLTAGAIAAALDALLARDLITATEHGAYAFRHVLIREVAYSTLARAERVRMHVAFAARLETFAADRLDEYVELLAYHYGEAVRLARQSAVPQGEPVDPARAIHFLERAGELASRAGAFVEAGSHLRSAISLAPADEHLRLYEKVGDCSGWGDIAAESYRQALAHWRAAGEQDPLVGARLLRKLLIGYVRLGDTGPGREEMLALRTEARRLAEAAGDQDEMWRLRVANYFWLVSGGEATAAEIAEGRATFRAAAEYFEARGDPLALSQALGAYTELSILVGDHEGAVSATTRRLDTPELTPLERGDALAVLAWEHFKRGDYASCVASMRESLARVRPGDPVLHLGLGASYAALAAYLSGDWSNVPAFGARLEEAWRQSRHDPNLWTLQYGYFALLRLALAREDPAAAAQAAAVLESIFAREPYTGALALVSAHIHDDPARLALDPARYPNYLTRGWVLMFLSERGEPAPAALLDSARAGAQAGTSDFLVRCVQIADALAAGDNVRLALAIDDAETHGLVPHAARMRIVLAQRAADPAPLPLARPTLERLDDRQSLRSLDEVAAALG
jgi:hypothetical protein